MPRTFAVLLQTLIWIMPVQGTAVAQPVECGDLTSNVLRSANCGFDSGIAGWSVDWGENAAHNAVEGNPSPGSYQIDSLDDSDGDRAITILSPCVPIAPSATYEVSGQFKLTNPLDLVGCEYFVAGYSDGSCTNLDSGMDSAFVTVTGSNWTSVFETFVSPPAASSMNMYVICYEDASGPDFTMLMDNFIAQDSGVIAHYPFDGTANDASGNGHHGTVVGATPVPGRIGGAYHFDGDDSIDVPDSPDFSLGSDDFTLALWLKLDVTTGNYYAMGHDEGPGAPNSKWIFWVNPGTSEFFLHVHSSTIDFNVRSPQTWVAETEWQHLAITRAGTLFSFYVDGMLLGVDSNATAIPDPDTTFQMGTAESGHPERVLRGALDDVRLYRRALNASEVSQLANPGIFADGFESGDTLAWSNAKP